ncbi:GntR family transcriptional regulator [Actinopolymorpha sp. NPDC004070]|uniref:GntR family transcriptional regulator n=1 Tax=Actinopolymorpha sp. NPDC004070 TaxID=3154548 RepID=UPI0033B3932B
MTAHESTRRIPLYESVKASLRATIARGEYVPGTPFVTERGICEKYGVSKTTAVRALNDLVAEGVLVRRQGSGTYVAEKESAAPAAGRAAGTSGRHPTIACVLQGHGGTHVERLLGGVAATCSALGYRMFLVYSDNDPEREAQALRQALDSEVDGILLYPAEGTSHAGLFAEIRRRNVPLVMMDRYRPDVPTDAVVADNLAVGYQVTQELLALGHRRILTLWNEIDCSSVRDRLTGHVQALRDHGVPVRPDLTVLRRYEGRPGPGVTGTIEALLSRPDPPTVLLCGNGYTLAQAAENVVALGMEIPGELDLAGMDDSGPFNILPLTAVAATLPSRELGSEAVRLLHSRIGSTEPYRDVRRVVLPIGVRTRDSAPGHLRVHQRGK